MSINQRYNFRFVTEGETPNCIGVEISGTASLEEIKAVHAAMVGIRKGLPVDEALELIETIKSRATK